MRATITIIILLNNFSFINSNCVIEFNKNGKEGVIFHEPYPLNKIGFQIWNPTLKEVLRFDSLVFKKHSNELGGHREEKFLNNSPVIANNEFNYVIQAFGEFRNGERILYIKYIWKDYLLEHFFWKEEIIHVFGDSSHYWFIKVNLDKKSYSVIVGGLVWIEDFYK